MHGEVGRPLRVTGSLPSCQAAMALSTTPTATGTAARTSGDKPTPIAGTSTLTVTNTAGGAAP